MQHGEPEGNGPRKVSMEARIEAGQLLVTVSDRAQRPETELERLFDMFFRATYKTSGAGLGLTIARKCARQLGGEIQVQASNDHLVLFIRHWRRCGPS